MAQISIHRKHTLGLAKARKVAWQWAEEVEEKFSMDCTVIESDDGDTVEFVRSGVKGTLTVAADHFDLQAQLGILLGAFAKTIEREIEGNLDALLKTSGAPAKAVTAGKAAKPAKPAKAAAPASTSVKKTAAPKGR